MDNQAAFLELYPLSIDKYKSDIVNIDLSKKFVKQDEYLMELPKILIKDLKDMARMVKI